MIFSLEDVMAKRKTDLNKKKTLIIVISAVALLLTAAVITVVLVLGGETDIPALDTDDMTTDEIETSFILPVPVETEPPVIDPTPVYAHGTAFDFVKKDMGQKPAFIDPLTGMAADKDLSAVRPVAIMINNIEQAIPQIGISNADVLYECLAEGGVTRLLMVTRDYEALGTIGSVRSSREYYIDFAKNHDAIYVHAGGSETAYSQIYSRSIEHLDGVRADSRTGKNVSSTVFYRDPDRLKKYAYEHTLVTTGERIVKGIEAMGYTRTLKNGFSEPVKPIDWGWSVALNGESATHIKVPYRSNRISEYEYDAATGKYKRFQYTHKEHIDGATGEQLRFENIFILNVPHRNTGDSYGHLNVTTVGEGSGWYISGGKRIAIKWAKPSQDEAMTLTDLEGNPIIVNQGKTVINIVDNGVYSSVSFN